MTKPERLPVPRVEVHRYFGRNGGFDFVGHWLWRCYLIGVKGQEKFGGSWQMEGMGHLDKQYAMRDAREWAKFTGWPLVDRGVVPAYNETFGPRKEIKV
jgi:hypothetical protein